MRKKYTTVYDALMRDGAAKRSAAELTEGRQKILDALPRFTRCAYGRCERDNLQATLKKAEAFISGFEDDTSQEGVPELLAEIRAAMVRGAG